MSGVREPHGPSNPRCYSTFLRSCTNWREFGSAEKKIIDEDLTYNEARDACTEYNANLTDKEKENGTKMEFTS